MKWIYDACGNAVLEEIAFAGMGVPAILEDVDLSLRAEGRCGRRHVPPGAFGKEARRGERVGMPMRRTTSLRSKPALTSHP